METGMSFDEEYARWLQHLYDSDFGAFLERWLGWDGRCEEGGRRTGGQSDTRVTAL